MVNAASGRSEQEIVGAVGRCLDRVAILDQRQEIRMPVAGRVEMDGSY